MTEEDVFLIDILSRPDDEVPRLIYADWLEDHDDPRADLNRQGWLWRDSPATSPNRGPQREQILTQCENQGWIFHDGLILTWNHLVTVFRFRLAETIAFCAGRPLPLRTWELDPSTLVGAPQEVNWPFTLDWDDIFIELSLARRRLLERAGRAPTKPANNLLGGRLLFFDPRATLWARESHRYSDGFFDIRDLPPWDTWVLSVPEWSPSPEDSEDPYFGYRIAWVPRDHLQRARSGIEVNGTGGLRWLDEVNTPFMSRLRASGMTLK